MKFRATLIPSGNATGVEVPDEVMAGLGPERRPAVAITINGHSWRSRVAVMRGACLIGISAANRAAAGIGEGEMIEVEIVLDEAPRVVAAPADLAGALDRLPEARTAFDRLPFGLKQKHVRSIEEAKSAEVRQRRLERLVASLR